MSTRIAVVGIVIEILDNIKEVNSILSEYDKLIVGRMGLPYKEKNIRVISIVVDGTTDEISAITGKIGKLKGVSVKAAISKTSF
ncbi:iron-only hydrogenase system regulator [Clostridium perfringens]|nr:iron-only hydrogenase system regulator [Clostridium perfringens]